MRGVDEGEVVAGVFGGDWGRFAFCECFEGGGKIVGVSGAGQGVMC